MKMIIKRRTDNNTILIFTLITLAIVLYLGNTLALNTSELVDVICLVSFPFMNIAGILAVVSFLIPVNSGITVLYIYGYAILVLLFKRKSISARVLVPTGIIFLYEVIMSMFVPNWNIQTIIIYVCTFFLLLYMIYTDEADYRLCCYTYIAGAMVLLLSVMTTAIQNTSLELVLSGVVRIGTYGDLDNLGGRVAIITENANSLAYYALVAIILAFSLIKNEKLWGKIVLMVAMLFGIVVGLFSVSRSFLLVLIFGVFLVFVSRFDFKQKLLLILVVGGILYIGIPYLIDNTQIFDAFENRFNDTATAQGSGRIGLFLEYLDFLWNNVVRLFFGTGAVYYKSVCNCSNSIHCGIEQILVSYGAVGFIPMLYVLLKPISDYFHTYKFRLEKIVPIICVIIFTQTIQFLNPFNLMLPYAVAIMYMKIPSKE